MVFVEIVMAKKKAKPKDDADAEDIGPVAVNDAWTGMLVISFLALSIGAGFLFYEWAFRYDYGAEPPKVPKANVGAPPVAKPPEPPKVDDKKPDDKKDEKVDATRPSRTPIVRAVTLLSERPRFMGWRERIAYPAGVERFFIS